MENGNTNKKFFCPDLLFIAQQLSRYSDTVNLITDHLATLLDCDNENEENYSRLVGIILQQIFDKLIDTHSEIKDLRENFPSMSMSEWEKFNDKWEKFIDKIDDLKLNEKTAIY